MRLLVSVRSGGEVAEALSGGADIIDAKEPRNGPLGSVASATLIDIADRVPVDCPLSIALGDLIVPADVERSIFSTELTQRVAPVYLKLGFAGELRANRIARLLTAAVRAASGHLSGPRIVAASYADSTAAGTASPGEVLRAALDSGCSGILLDTYQKTGENLFNWFSPATLETWIAEAKDGGLLTAVAGGLNAASVMEVCSAAPDVIGIRGAACEAGRDTRLNALRVAEFKQAMLAPVRPLFGAV